jgi:hypothetical protein
MWRREIYERIHLGKSPTTMLGEAAARYFETILKPHGKPGNLARDLGYIKQIKDAFGSDRKLTDINQAEVAKWRDELVTKRGLASSSANRIYTVLRAIVNKARDEWRVHAPKWTLRQLETGEERGTLSQRCRREQIAAGSATSRAGFHHGRDGQRRPKGGT